jgi:hypothetical protein
MQADAEPPSFLDNALAGGHLKVLRVDQVRQRRKTCATSIAFAPAGIRSK